MTVFGRIASQVFGSKRKKPEVRKTTIYQHPVTEYSENTPIYNILVLGQSQSGKSTLVEAIRRYADPTCSVRYDRIGNGIRSHTTDVMTEQVSTALPEYEVVNRKTGQPVKIVQYFENPRKFIVEMNQRNDLELKSTVRQGARVCRFQIFDTPGLDDTSGTDVHHIRRTLSDIRAAQEIHLVIIMVNSQVQFTQGLQDALKTYKNVFSTMGDLMVFLHSKVRNEHQTPEDKIHWPAIQQRIEFLGEIMNQQIPHFMVDCDLYEDRPVHNCFTFNKIHSLLQLATFNRPVMVDTMPLHKTEKMIIVDKVVAQHYKALFEAEDRTCKELDIAYQLRARIDDKQRLIEELKSFIRIHETDRLVLVFQQRFDENWRYFYRREPVDLEFPAQPFRIDRRDVLCFSIVVSEEAGGVGHDTWRTKFIRKPYEFGMYHVKLYTKQRNKYRREISIRKTQLIVFENELESLEEQQKIRFEQLKENSHRNGAILDPLSEETITKIMSRRARYARILERISDTTLSWGMYRDLDEAKAYEGNLATCSERVKAFYDTYQPPQTMTR